VGGGASNTAQGNYSFAAGYRAKAVNGGTFVWADSLDYDFNPFQSPGIGGVVNTFNVRATGGVALFTGVDANHIANVGAQLLPGSGSWSVISDRNVKANLAPVDGRDVLARLSALPIHTWSYTTQDPSIRHVGPMAQDFYAAFGVGEDERYISTVDADGVALAAIQGLYQVVQERDGQIAAQQQQIATLEARLSALEQAMERGSKGAAEQRRTLPIADSSLLPVSLLSGLVVAAVLVGQRRYAGGGR